MMENRASGKTQSSSGRIKEELYAEPAMM